VAEEEAARLAALRNSGGGDEGDSGGRMNAGRKAYQAMMQHRMRKRRTILLRRP